ncbi:uncharacterized protein BJ212DRAFT_1260134 [Suillus subaureus]|uniref:Transmembrane protein 135 N-terminal domain-containing protein n=1 Tax=Suillus subaureus TaxID=48587 RepID=A0A9P7EM61_9AGAM|nr:uncharacterized protein BJ212DRAFT_1260134 [Suillus subaureus]KAG1825935.1 hypothetical protein BJ212DRAFT_1260134 [Suillus subaureus]
MSAPFPRVIEHTEPDSDHSKISWRNIANPKNLWPDDPSHPAKVAIRTYSLSLSLSLGPVLLPVALTLVNRSSSLETRLGSFRRVLRREVGLTGFPFAITVAVCGGIALKHFWEAVGVRHVTVDKQDSPEVRRQPVVASTFQRRTTVLSLAAQICSRMSNSTPSGSQKAFLSNILSSTIALFLLQRARPSKAGSHRPFTTFGFTLLFFCRATDAIMQHFLSVESARKANLFNTSTNRSNPNKPSADVPMPAKGDSKAKKWHQSTVAWLDAVVFWACSARIMWCFFYQPHRLPPSYVKWISSLANLDKRLLDALRVMRSKEWVYGHSSTHSHLLTSYANDRGYPSSWGDPQVLPACGGTDADVVWKALGVPDRGGVGGLPCELLHSGITTRWGLDNSCLTNVGVRFCLAFIEAMALYLPVHFLPLLFTRPSSILQRHRAIPALLAAIRSATFLSTFLSSYFSAVCLTRTLVLAKLFPWIPHDVWDGPHGCVLAGSLTCGWSILIENTRRRGEMALYVLPRAVKASLPAKWIAGNHAGARLAERIVFVLSLASLLTFAVHEPESLRGLSRWTLAFVMKGPNTAFWKKRKEQIETCNCPQTPISPSSNSISTQGIDHL